MTVEKLIVLLQHCDPTAKVDIQVIHRVTYTWEEDTDGDDVQVWSSKIDAKSLEIKENNQTFTIGF